MQKKKKVIIIGAGLAGMSAGCYLQMNGFDTEIFESYSMSGGLCASWKRKDYNIDGCIHFMEGTAPDGFFYPFWNNLIDMKAIDFEYFDSHSAIDDKDGNRIYFYSDIDKLEKEFLTKAPEDKARIKEFIGLVRKFNKVKLPIEKPFEAMNFMDKMKAAWQMFPYLYKMQKYLKITNQEFAQKLKNKPLKYAMETAFVGHMPLFYSIMPLVWRNKKDAGYPKGGAGFISGLMETRYKELGGKIHFSSRVGEIITENNSSKGIILENGEEYLADIVVNAADGKTAIYEMLKGKYKDKNIVERYESSTFETIDKTLYIAIGVNKDFSNEPRKLHFELEKPIYVDSMTTMEHLEVTHYCADPHAAPKGKSLLALMPEGKNWEYWFNLRKDDKQQYVKEKIRVANAIIEALD
ncbi:MAG TPA: FAD-dependent oxidoreductase, partial [Bacteroidales bacterium]